MWMLPMPECISELSAILIRGRDAAEAIPR
jgi:hypothetical protein